MGHSCFPVVHDDLDDLIGILFVNDIFRTGEGRPVARDATDPSPLEISRKVRQPYLIPESLGVLEALADMRKHRRAVAVVVDEYGGVAGMLTVKDLLEPLVGDLHDEFDEEDEPMSSGSTAPAGSSTARPTSTTSANASASTSPTASTSPWEACSSSGSATSRPRANRSTGGGWDFRVVEMDKRRIAQVVATPVTPPHAAATPEGQAD